MELLIDKLSKSQINAQFLGSMSGEEVGVVVAKLKRGRHDNSGRNLLRLT
jgi:hypothetical protein